MFNFLGNFSYFGLAAGIFVLGLAIFFLLIWPLMAAASRASRDEERYEEAREQQLEELAERRSRHL